MPGRKLCQRGAPSRLPDGASEPRTIGLLRTGADEGFGERATSSAGLSSASAFAAARSAGHPPASAADRRSTSRAMAVDIARDMTQASNSASFDRDMAASSSVGLGGGTEIRNALYPGCTPCAERRMLRRSSFGAAPRHAG